MQKKKQSDFNILMLVKKKENVVRLYLTRVPFKGCEINQLFVILIIFLRLSDEFRAYPSKIDFRAYICYCKRQHQPYIPLAFFPIENACLLYSLLQTAFFVFHRMLYNF